MEKVKNVCFNNWCCGSHMRFEGSLSETLTRSVNMGMCSVQFFMGNPKNVHSRTEISESDIKSCHQIIKNFPINVFSHFPYCVNLTGSISTKCLAWEEKNEKTDKEAQIKCENNIKSSLRSIEYELEVLANFKTKTGVVIHPGNWFDRKQGLNAISKSINKIKFPPNSTLLLENSAGQGNSLATTLSELKQIYDGLNENQKSHVGICIDTCHLFAYGDYDIRKKSEVDRFMSDFDKLFTRDKLKLIHLNDSTTDFKSRKDNHALIGEGYIWKNNLEPLIYFLNCVKGIPLVLETIPDDIFTIADL